MSSIKTPNSKFNLINERVKYGTDGGINIDSGTLVVNPITMNVGINMLNPTSTFDVSSIQQSNFFNTITNPGYTFGNDTQVLTDNNTTPIWSYNQYNFDGNSVDISAIYVGPIEKYPYAGGVLAPNGKIYCIPFGATNVGIINPYNNTIDTTSIPASGLFQGGVLAPNGKIYCIPVSAPYVAIIDPVNNTFDTTTISTSRYPELSNSNKFWGGVLAPNGKIYCGPRGVSYVGIIDTINNTFDSSVTFTPPVSGELYQWSGGSLGSNGNVYFSPFGADKVLRIRPSDNSLNLFGILGSGGGGGRYYGSCTGPDGNIYCMPYNQNTVLRIDVSNETVSTPFTFSYSAGGNRGTCGGTSLGPDGIIYGIPGPTLNSSLHNKLFYYNPLTGTGGSLSVNFRINSGYSPKWFGYVMAPNGNIYMIPHRDSHVGIIKTGLPTLQYWMTAPEFNKF